MAALSLGKAGGAGAGTLRTLGALSPVSPAREQARCAPPGGQAASWGFRSPVRLPDQEYLGTPSARDQAVLGWAHQLL